jgi:hypothetical protein
MLSGLLYEQVVVRQTWPRTRTGRRIMMTSVPKFRDPGDRAVTYGNFDSKLHEVSLSYAKLRFN